MHRAVIIYRQGRLRNSFKPFSAARVGAISAEVFGGKAGTGALVGAGSNVLGEALIGILVG